MRLLRFITVLLGITLALGCAKKWEEPKEIVPIPDFPPVSAGGGGQEDEDWQPPAEAEPTVPDSGKPAQPQPAPTDSQSLGIE